MKRY